MTPTIEETMKVVDSLLEKHGHLVLMFSEFSDVYPGYTTSTFYNFTLPIKLRLEKKSTIKAFKQQLEEMNQLWPEGKRANVGKLPPLTGWKAWTAVKAISDTPLPEPPK